MSEDDVAPPQTSASDTMLEQAHDIGAAVAKLDLLAAGHETLKAAIDDVKGTIQFVADRVTELSRTIGEVTERVVKLEPAQAAGDAVEGAAAEGDKAVDSVAPGATVENPAAEKKSIVKTVHDIFG